MLIGHKSYQNTLIGLGADGASVNSGKDGGVQALFQEILEWIVFVWCHAHKLELALSDSLKNTFFKDVDNVLLKLYYLYEKSGKKLCELEEIHTLMRQCFEFEEGSRVKPVRANGTRWLAHKVAALERVYDKYGIYIVQLENVSVDPSYKADQRAKVSGYLKSWKTSKMLLHVAFYLDLLTPFKYLSLVFQKESADTVDATRAIVKMQKRVKKL